MTQTTPDPRDNHHRRQDCPRGGCGHGLSATRSLSLLLCLGALAGVLIWAKLRLVTDIPRSAYADPKDRQVDDARAGRDSGVDSGARGDPDPAIPAEDLDAKRGGDTPDRGGDHARSVHRP